jgi:hypothetical protein
MLGQEDPRPDHRRFGQRPPDHDRDPPGGSGDRGDGRRLRSVRAARRLAEEVPDVITLDVEMPRMDGITFLRKLMSPARCRW